ncbi:hypothetical protein K7432_005440 [Basidiobolus ranarum]|uniref:Uncharacterized protein n=1 Tax=Basidiobolus ranarum TaxID=34480 RepID=A0ABR2W3N1_9FUNG
MNFLTIGAFILVILGAANAGQNQQKDCRSTGCPKPKSCMNLIACDLGKCPQDWRCI